MIKVFAFTCIRFSSGFAETFICQMNFKPNLPFMDNQNKLMDAINKRKIMPCIVTAFARGGCQFEIERSMISAVADLMPIRSVVKQP